MMKKKGLAVIAFLMLADMLSAQLYFDHVTTASGLSHNKVNCLLEDNRGFIWIGTEDGLNRYDGERFVRFNHEPGNPSSLSGNIIRALHEDPEGIIWIATADGGITKYDYRLSPEKQFKQYRHRPGDSSSIPVNMVNDIIEDKQHYLWLATGGAGLLRFNKTTGLFQQVTRFSRTYNDLVFDKDGWIWGGRLGGSISKVNPATLEVVFDKRYENYYQQLPHVVVTTLFKDRDDDIWFGSWDKAVYRYDVDAGSEMVYDASGGFPNDEIISINEDKTGMIWAGGKSGGLYIFDKGRNRFVNYRHDPSQAGSVIDNTINCIMRDRDGRMWLGTNKGINWYDPYHQQFKQTFLLGTGNQNTIYDFFEDENSNLWIGTTHGIFIRRNGRDDFEQHQIFYNKVPLAVTRFYKDDGGTFYIGTDYTLFQLDPVSFRIQPLPNTDKDVVMKKIIQSRVVSVIRDTLDGKPVLLVSPYGHYLAYYDLQQKKWFSRTDSTKEYFSGLNVNDNLIRKLYKNSKGEVWMVNATNGISLLKKNNQQGIQYLNDPSNTSGISSNNLFDMLEDISGNYWFTTYGGSLNFMDGRTKKFTHYNSPANLMEGLQGDRKGNLWIICNGNLYSFDTKGKAFVYYPLPDVENSGGVKGYIYKGKDGKMYVAGNNYFIEFVPEKISRRAVEPQVYITDFKVFDKSYSDLLYSRQIRLRYFQNYFTIEFSAPDFSGSDKVQYSYKLEGQDGDWVVSGQRNQAFYTNVDGGRYTFKVRATNNIGNWNTDITQISIVIIPPFWKQWWFYVLCAVAVAGIVYAIYRYRLNEILNRQAIRNKIAQDLHDNVGSTLSSISVYSQVAKIQSAKNNKESVDNAIEKISETSSSMISEMSDIVWAINPRNDSVKEIVQRMQSFAAPLLAAKDITFSFQYDPVIESLALSMEKRKNFFMTFKEAINNAVKYAECKNLVVEIKAPHRQRIEMIIADDGKGFDVNQPRKGNGLWNSRYRANEMKGEYTLKSEPGRGTTVKLVFPIP
ncbi:MAG: two-component regulator propeller domain-containing protein [Chitinophagaceae bacterium]|nr:two-component regulator propeller domain-containing protein [Chitinophagaceae bacterium]